MNDNLKDTNPFDAGYPEGERLPLCVVAEFCDESDRVSLILNGVPVGSDLSDASLVPDGYRFHDAFHLAFAACLGWSPVLRAMLGVQRRSDARMDECEDGGRARMVEEAICHVIYDYARENGFEEVSSSPSPVLVRYVRRLAMGFEGGGCSEASWSRAVQQGCLVFDQLRKSRGGNVVADLEEKSLAFEAPIAAKLD